MKPPSPKQFIRDLEDGQRVDTVFLVREKSLRSRKGGEDYLKLKLSDTSGTVEAVVWEDAAAAAHVAEPGATVRVEGPYKVDPKYGATITVRQIEPVAAEDVDPSELIELPGKSIEVLDHELRELVASIARPALRTLLERLFDPGSESGRLVRQAPAAKYYHQAYRHGLLEHTLSVAQSVDAITRCFSGIDRDVAVTGALVHDIGKIDAYEFRGHAIELTQAGRLHGEIPLGFYGVRRLIEEIPDFPDADADAILHIVLSHHGSLAHGSPVVPCTREAMAVHMIDNLGGRLGSFDRLEKNLREGAGWSEWDRALEGHAFFPDRIGDDEDADG